MIRVGRLLLRCSARLKRRASSFPNLAMHFMLQAAGKHRLQKVVLVAVRWIAAMKPIDLLGQHARPDLALPLHYAQERGRHGFRNRWIVM